MRIFIFAIFFVLASCATAPRKVPPAPATPAARATFKKLEGEATTKKTSASMQKLKSFADENHGKDVAHDAYMTLGRLHCARKQYAECYNAYVQVINSEFISPHEVEAVIGASQALLELDRYDEVLSLTMRGLRTDNISNPQLVKLYSLRLEALAKTGDRLEALRALSFLSDHAESEPLRARSRLRAIELVQSLDDLNILKKIASDTSFGSVRPEALYRVGVLEFEGRNYSSAGRYLSEVTKIAPDSEVAARAQRLIEQISARNRVDPLVVGAVLPLSGRHGAIGYKTLRGLQMGLGITDRNPSNFKLAVVDSAGNPDIARRGVERLVVEDSAIAVVGDIVSRSAGAVAEKSDELGLPNISLAQKSGLPQEGPYVFRNALTSEALVRELVRAAMEDQGLRKFAILYPNDPYGVEYTNIFWDEVKARGGEIRGAQAYDVSSRQFGDAIKRLVGTFYIAPREQELNHHLREWYSRQRTINARTKAPDDLLKPIVDFDAIFIPDSLSNLAQVASMLVYHDIKNVRLLGTNLWNSSDLPKRGTKLINNAIFVDALSSMGENLRKSNFYRDYKAKTKKIAKIKILIITAVKKGRV